MAGKYFADKHLKHQLLSWANDEAKFDSKIFDNPILVLRERMPCVIDHLFSQYTQQPVPPILAF